MKLFQNLRELVLCVFVCLLNEIAVAKLLKSGGYKSDQVKCCVDLILYGKTAFTRGGL